MQILPEPSTNVKDFVGLDWTNLDWRPACHVRFLAIIRIVTLPWPLAAPCLAPLLIRHLNPTGKSCTVGTSMSRVRAHPHSVLWGCGTGNLTV